MYLMRNNMPEFFDSFGYISILALSKTSAVVDGKQ